MQEFSTFDYNWPGNGLLKEKQRKEMLKCALSRWKVSLSAVWNRPGGEREMFSLVSAGLNLLPARRKGKERSSIVSAAFYGARGGVPGQNSIGHSHWMKCLISNFKAIPTLNNNVLFFLLQMEKRYFWQFVTEKFFFDLMKVFVRPSI